MQESHTPVSTQDDTRHAPLHEDIAQCARDIWVECGRPADRDLEIWLKAEQRLFSATKQSSEKSSSVAKASGRLPAKPARS